MGERSKESGGGNEEGIKGEKEEQSRLPQSSLNPKPSTGPTPKGYTSFQ